MNTSTQDVHVVQSDRKVKVLTRGLGHWMTGHVTAPVHEGLVTVQFEHDGIEYRKHVLPHSHRLSELTDITTANPDANSKSQDVASWLESLPIEPNTNLAAISTHEAQGKRKYMEDKHIVIDPWGPNGDMAFLAVYDGHTDAVGAEFAKANLHNILLEHLKPLKDPTEVDFARAFKLTFRQVNDGICELTEGGTTATVAVVHRRGPDAPTRLHVANVGDSPAILFGHDIIVNASVDHNVRTNDVESARVRAAGMHVSADGYVYCPVRQDGSIQVTRSLGDSKFKSGPSGLPAVDSTPHVFFHEFEGWETGLILTSDGVFEGLEGKDMPVPKILVEYALEGLNSGKNSGVQPPCILERVMDTASNLVYIARKSSDNMTAVVGFFRTSGHMPGFPKLDAEIPREQDPGAYIMPGGLPENEYDKMWHRTAIQNVSQGYEGANVIGDQQYLATGTFLKVFSARYTEGPRKGQKAVTKYFLAEGQGQLKRNAKLRRVYTHAAWSDEIKAATKAAEIITHFNLMMRKKNVTKLVQINLPECLPTLCGGETALAEPFIEGEYMKFNSNSGWVDDKAGFDFIQALSHFSYDFTEGECLLCDLQGGRYHDRYILTDPVLLSPQEGRWGETDLGLKGIQSFFKHHRCTQWCLRDENRRTRNPAWRTPYEIPDDCDISLEKGTSRTTCVPCQQQIKYGFDHGDGCTVRRR